jgi:hypothetical protein
MFPEPVAELAAGRVWHRTAVITWAKLRGRLKEASDPFAGYSPWVGLGWSVEAVHRAADRVNRIHPNDPVGAFAAIGEAVWWITLTNDTLLARHPSAYNLALDSQSPRVDDVIVGLRSVRHRIGHEVDFVDFIELVAARADPGDGRITAWAWRSVRPPTRRRERDLAHHRAYEAELAGHNVVEGFMRATGFLGQAHANAQSGLSAGGE